MAWSKRILQIQRWKLQYKFESPHTLWNIWTFQQIFGLILAAWSEVKVVETVPVQRNSFYFFFLNGWVEAWEVGGGGEKRREETNIRDDFDCFNYFTFCFRATENDAFLKARISFEHYFILEVVIFLWKQESFPEKWKNKLKKKKKNHKHVNRETERKKVKNRG